jgi:hypothetical protein
MFVVTESQTTVYTKENACLIEALYKMSYIYSNGPLNIVIKQKLKKK